MSALCQKRTFPSWLKMTFQAAASAADVSVGKDNHWGKRKLKGDQ
jgi:hypothetical protein